jgi:hypothetical protein
MKEFSYCLFAILSFAVQACAWIVKLAIPPLRPAVKASTPGRVQQAPAVKVSNVSMQPDPTDSETHSLTLISGQQYLEMKNDAKSVPSKVSTRVITMPIEAHNGLPLGIAWIYLYDSDVEGKSIHSAKRLLKFSNRQLAKIFCGPNETRYFFKDVEYIPMQGTEKIQKELIDEIKMLLNRKSSQSKASPKRENVIRPDVQSAQQRPVVKAVVVDSPVRVAPKQPDPAPVPPAYKPARDVDRSVMGVVHEGVVVHSGITTKTGRDGKYQSFTLTINNGSREVPLNGVEIERQIADLGIKTGERIRIVDMGRTEVSIPGQVGPRHKNLYQVSRLDSN